ncbi:MAG: hypothetical protein V1662_00105 [Candidatus Omnitrophota bacterium]
MKTCLVRKIVFVLVSGILLCFLDKITFAFDLGKLVDPAGIMPKEVRNFARNNPGVTTGFLTGGPFAASAGQDMSTMFNLMKEVGNFAKSYPGVTTGLLTGDPCLASASHNAFTMLNPHSETKGSDAFFSGAFFHDPAGYYSTTFLSGASGEPLNMKGLTNYSMRVTAGTTLGAASGAARGWSYGGPWGALGGALTEGSIGGLAGSLTSPQAKRLSNDMVLGIDSLKQYGLSKDVLDFHNASWEVGHEHTFGADLYKLNARIGLNWAGAAGKMAGERFGPSGIEQLEKWGIPFPGILNPK